MAKATDDATKAVWQKQIKFNETRYADAQKTRYELPALTIFSCVKGRQALKHLDDEWKSLGEVNGSVASEKEYKEKRARILKEIDDGINLSIEGIADFGSGNEA